MSTIVPQRTRTKLVRELLGNESGSEADFPKILAITTVDISKLVIHEKKLDEEFLMELDESIRVVGQIRPVVVHQQADLQLVLIDGHHLCAALQRNGLEKVEALIVDCADHERCYYELVSKLYQRDLSVLERAEYENEWRLIVEGKVGQIAPPGGHQPAEKSLRKTAALLSTSREHVRRSEKISSLAPIVKETAKIAGFANNQDALLKVAAKATVEDQLETIENLTFKSKLKSKRLPPDSETHVSPEQSTETMSAVMMHPTDQCRLEVDNIWSDWLRSDFAAKFSECRPVVRRKFLTRLFDIHG